MPFSKRSWIDTTCDSVWSGPGHGITFTDISIKQPRTYLNVLYPFQNLATVACNAHGNEHLLLLRNSHQNYQPNTLLLLRAAEGNMGQT